MRGLESLPWSRINDYLVHVGSARTLEEFDRRAVESINILIPHERTAGSFVFHGRVPALRQVLGGWEDWRRAYNTYYKERLPIPLNGESCRIVEFSDWEHTEYVTDFIRPAGIGRVLSMTRGRYQLAVLRSRRDPPFSDRDTLIMEVLRPHLNNFFRGFSAPAPVLRERMREVELAPGRTPLTRREAQIVDCLRRRMTSREIGGALGMSHRTAERHVQNMYEKLGVRSRRDLLDLLGQDS